MVIPTNASSACKESSFYRNEPVTTLSGDPQSVGGFESLERFHQSPPANPCRFQCLRPKAIADRQAGNSSRFNHGLATVLRPCVPNVNSLRKDQQKQRSSLAIDHHYGRSFTGFRWPIGGQLPISSHRNHLGTIRPVGGSSQGSATTFPHTNQTHDISSNHSHRHGSHAATEASSSRSQGPVGLCSEDELWTTQN